MTEKIKNAIEHLDVLIGMVEDNQNTDYDSDFKLAIRSLKAWEEVLNELEEVKEDVTEFNIEYYLGELNGLNMATRIINQKLAEIEGKEQK